MKFSDKLIKLRKEKLLSQEELGEKLNVTRQTVSKWELGQTTPDMDKLLEMSKLFGISLDQLTSDSDINADNPIRENNNTKKKVIILLIIFAFLCTSAFLVYKMLVSRLNMFNGLFNRTSSISIADWSSKSFNSNFDFYEGTESGNRVQSLIDAVVKNNKTDDRKVTLIYNETKTSNTEELVELKRNFDDSFKKFEIQFDYDEDGYIYQGTISDIETTSNEEDTQTKQSEWDREYDKSSFNVKFTMYNGTKYGTSVLSLIDAVATNNQTNDRKVTVEFNNTKTTDPAELRNLKRSVEDKWDEYEIYFEYDEEGYIYEAVIEKL